MNAEPEHISQKEFEEIERYLQGDMNDTEHAAFEERMAEDEELRKAVAYYGTLIEGVETAALKSRLDVFHAKIEPDATSGTGNSANQNKSLPFLKYLIAASVLIAAGLATWLIVFQESPQEELFAAYFEPDPGLITPMSSTDRYEFYAGMIDYKRENYEEAISKWQPLLREKPKSDTLNYFLGVAHLAQGNEDEALPHFQTSVETEGSAFTNEAYYYLGLAYLKNDNREAAIQALKNSHSDRAAELLGKIEDDE